jgi:hypothetical protein
MKLLTRMLLLTILLLSIAAGLVALQPDHFQVRRSIRIQATPAAIFPLISRPRAWPAWTYWHRADPEMQRQYKGPDQGKDAEWEWQSRTQGNGGIRFTEVYADQGGILRYASGRFAASGQRQSGADSRRRRHHRIREMQASTGERWLLRALAPFADRLIGNDFETGLQKLKVLAEQTPVPAH